jgi:hypothetical protein
MVPVLIIFGLLIQQITGFTDDSKLLSVSSFPLQAQTHTGQVRVKVRAMATCQGQRLGNLTVLESEDLWRDRQKFAGVRCER